MEKVYLSIIAEHDTSGKIHPLSIKWTDGRVFTVDKIIDVRQAATMKTGGQGMRYTCRIYNKEVYLFCDDGRWFIDK